MTAKYLTTNSNQLPEAILCAAETVKPHIQRGSGQHVYTTQLGKRCYLSVYSMRRYPAKALVYLGAFQRWERRFPFQQDIVG